jgi:hypothetical protein
MNDAVNDALTAVAWRACTSALRLERWTHGELSSPEADSLQAHVAGCRDCTEALRALQAGHQEELPAMRTRASAEATAPAQARTRWPRLLRSWPLAAAGLGAALAAGLLVVLRLPPGTGAPGTSLKGPGVGLSMFVQHGGSVRRAEEGEVVAPGDAVRFAVTSPVKAYVAVLSVDPQGRASVYFPLGPRAEPVEPGVESPLPLGTRLDGTVGEERIWALLCPEPIALEPLRAQLERGRDEALLSRGCRVIPWRFVKR